MYTQTLNEKRALWYPTKNNVGDSRNFVLFLTGFPKYPSKSEFTKFFLELGYDVLVPMYSGTFDSDGSFSIEQSAEDAKLWYKFIQKGVFFASPEESESFDVANIIIFSSSFGCLVADLALKKFSFELVHKCFFVSPLWGMSTYKHGESHNRQADETSRLMDFSYPHSYRFEDKDDFFGKLSGKLEINGMDGEFLDGTKKSYIFSGKEDMVTPPAMAEALAASHTASQIYTLDGGHSSKIDMGTFKEIMTRLCSNQQG